MSLYRTLILAAVLISVATPASGQAFTAPDPGGDEATSVALPPPGKYLGLNENMVGGFHGLSHVDNLELVRTIGGNTARTVIDWRLAEPARGVWGEKWWTLWAQFYADARRRGITPLFNIGYAPGWAREPEYQGCAYWSACEHPPGRAHDAEWSRFAAEVAKRFPGAIIEIWNEPNLKFYWESGADPQRFAELQALAYDAIKAVSPSTLVIAGGLSNVQRTGDGHIALRAFLQQAYDAQPSLRGHTDAIGFHPYPLSPLLGAGTLFAKSFEDVRAVRDAEGDSATPLFVTETGTYGWPDLMATEQQAEASMRIYHKTMTMPDVIGVVFHRTIEPQDTMTSAFENASGWTLYGENPPKPRPVYCLFVAAAKRSYPGCPAVLPLMVVLEDAAGSVGRSGTVSFKFESPNYGVTYLCSLDRAAFAPCWSGITYSAGSRGRHTFKVRARDSKGILSPIVSHAFKTL